MVTSLSISHYRGRFAPSPTGPLHFGSLVSAIASYLEAKSQGGKWLVRIEDLDRARETAGASREILRTLESLEMEWDGPVVYQSQCSAAYEAALSILQGKSLIYCCGCSRKEIADSSMMGIEGPVYPGTCRGRRPDGGFRGASRVRTDNKLIEFEDALQGRRAQWLESEIGDFVVRRADGVFAYQLAVVVDDAAEGITHVVRGADLLNSTPRQIHLQRLLNYPTPSYMHLPIVTDIMGEKLSKQTHAAPLDISNPAIPLSEGLQFLGQVPPVEIRKGDLASLWAWATQNWNPRAIPKKIAQSIYLQPPSSHN
jgi:glutamyl-Q tRNA(Asp) synthetase